MLSTIYSPEFIFAIGGLGFSALTALGFYFCCKPHSDESPSKRTVFQPDLPVPKIPDPHITLTTDEKLQMVLTHLREIQTLQTESIYHLGHKTLRLERFQTNVQELADFAQKYKNPRKKQ